MAKIRRRELSEVICGMVDIASLNEASILTSSPQDLFLCALGFEPRCLTLPAKLEDAGFRVERAVYLKYATNIDDNNANLPALERHLDGMRGKVEPLEAEAEEFPSRLRAVLDLIVSEAVDRPAQVTFDISVTANRLVLRCLKILLEYDVHLRIIYSEAAVYHPTQEEYEREPEKWASEDSLGLERGVSEIMPSIDHPGNALDPLPDRLVLFPSFKVERTRAITSFVDPSLLIDPGSNVVWLIGIPHLERDHWRMDAMRAINEIKGSSPQYNVSTFDYKETLRVLERLHAEASETHTITISPLGSKMQALGVALFCYMHPDVRVILSTPREYNAAQYSEGCKDVWQLELGSLRELRTKLDECGSLLIVEEDRSGDESSRSCTEP